MQTTSLMLLWRRQRAALQPLLAARPFRVHLSRIKSLCLHVSVFRVRTIERPGGGVHVQYPLSSPSTPHSFNWCIVRPRLASLEPLEPTEPTGRNKSDVSFALRSVCVTACACVKEACSTVSNGWHQPGWRGSMRVRYTKKTSFFKILY